MTEHANPVTDQRELWRHLLREAAQGLLAAEASRADLSLAAFTYVLAVGRCNRWAVDLSTVNVPTVTPQVAAHAVARLLTVIDGVIDDARALPERLDRADDLEAMRAAVDALESREAVEACLSAAFDSYVAGEESDPVVKQLGLALDAAYPRIEALDDALQSQAELLCVAAATHALDNWRALLADKHKDVLPWWLDGSLEQIHELIRESGIEAADLARLHSGEVRGGGVRVVSGRWRYRYTEAERRDLPLAAASGEVSHADQWQFSRWCECVLPNGATLSVSIEVTSQGGVELRLGGDKNVIQSVSGMRIGSRAAALSDPSLLFHWVLVMECPADRQILATLKQEPLSIEFHDSTMIVIQGEE